MRQPPSDPAARAELERLELAIRQARARRSQYLRELSGRNKTLETQRLCILGRAVTQFCDNDEAFRKREFAPFLARYVTRDSDVAALAGSAFELPKSADEQPHVDHEEY